MPAWMKWTISMLVALLLIWAGWRVMPILITLHVIVCFVLIVVIMLQSGSAADLAGAFGGAGSQTAFGPRGATTFLSRATTWCAIVFMLTSLTLSIKRSPNEGSGSILEQTSNPAPKKTTTPAPVTTTPAPVQSAPAQSAPIQSTPAQTAPVQSAPATTTPAPATTTPAPAQSTPAPSTPAQNQKK